jgi:pimeloyl-ACP methyl ester carboxylesterase
VITGPGSRSDAGGVDVGRDEGRTLRGYDSGDGQLVVVWFHGTPNLGPPPEPLAPLAAELGVRLVGYDRPGYGGSTPRPDRPVASAAGDVAALCDALGVQRFAVMSHSGGGPHALACAALLGERVLAAACIASLAPRDAANIDWFADMAPDGVAALRAAIAGRAAKEAHERSGAPYDPLFTEADLATLSGTWSWLQDVVGPAVEAGPDALIDDDLAYVRPWGVELSRVSCPTLLVHGGRDRVVPPQHSAALAEAIPRVTLWQRPDHGHLSVLTESDAVLRWLVDQAAAVPADGQS